MFEFHLQRRLDLTASCRDADTVPKVQGAGEVIERDGERLQVMHNGVVVLEDCYYGAWMTELIRRLRGHHEPQEEAAFHAVVERLRADPPAEPVMVELGSFWAYYSLWFARALPGARLVLVEPDPAHLGVGRRNLELNDVDGHFVHAAVGLPDGAPLELVSESDGVRRSVPRVSVDGLMAREGLERIDVLLCDTQGAELEMLEGARGAITEGRVRFLVVSTHHHSICGDPLMHERCLSALRELGAHVIAEHTVTESFSGDGLIVASTDPRDQDLRVELSRARARDSLFGGLEGELAAALAQRDAALAERDDAVARHDVLASRLEGPRAAVLSVCIPTHHGRCELLEQTLESVAGQISPGVEIVVSDNASHDGTEAMIERFRERHPRVRLVYARNDRDERLQNIMLAIERASGDWCWPLGSDDVMTDDGLDTVLRAVARHPRVSGVSFGKVNYRHDMQARVGQDVPEFSPASAQAVVYEGFETILRELAFQFAFLGTTVVRRGRWLDAAERAGPAVVTRHPAWPHLVILAEMARRDAAWAWLPDVLVKARAGRPYLTESYGDEPDLALMHATLVDGLRILWPQLAGRGTALHRDLLRKSHAVAASGAIVRTIKFGPGQTLARDLLLLRSFTRAFWRLPEFRRHELAGLLMPAAALRARQRAQATLTPMTRLAPEDIATAVRATLPDGLRPRVTATVRCVVTNRGSRKLRRAEPYPVALGFRWVHRGSGDVVLDSDRCQLARPLSPGESVALDARVNVPWEPGTYELRIAPVQEHVVWFDDVDPANGARLAVTLDPEPE